MKHLFITDPFSMLIPGHDSSLALIKSALHKGHQVYQCTLEDITWNNDHVGATICKIEHQEKFIQKESQKVSLEEMSLVWMRKDPPVDYPYIQACQLLRLAKTPVINNPNTLMTCDEKLLALEFPQLLPNTFIMQKMTAIRDLVKKYNKLIVKPIGGKGGEGIFLLAADDRNLGSLIELITNNGKQKVVLQEYLPSARAGDKRIFLLDGNSVGAVLRVPQGDDHRGNMAAGASIAKTEPSKAELDICEKLRPRFKELGLYLVGLDFIGEKLTEINITSPTCLEEIADLDGTDPAGEIIEWSKEFLNQ